jgi:2,4-didehydro-3-deoxy-L-rhamnonate hydrolase
MQLGSAPMGPWGSGQFRLGTFARADGTPFPGLVLGERVVPLERLHLLLRRLDTRLADAESMLGVLGSWDSNFAALRTAAEALGTADAGVESIDVRDLQVRPPIDVPRQIFCTIANYRSHIVDTVRDPALAPHLGEPDSADCLERASKIIEERLRTRLMSASSCRPR